MPKSDKDIVSLRLENISLRSTLSFQNIYKKMLRKDGTHFQFPTYSYIYAGRQRLLATLSFYASSARFTSLLWGGERGLDAHLAFIAAHTLRRARPTPPTALLKLQQSVPRSYSSPVKCVAANSHREPTQTPPIFNHVRNFLNTYRARLGGGGSRLGAEGEDLLGCVLADGDNVGSGISSDVAAQIRIRSEESE